MHPFPTTQVGSPPTLLNMSAAISPLRLLLFKLNVGSVHFLRRSYSRKLIMMLGSWRQQFLLFTLLAFVVLSKGSRLPKEYWKQMLPKKLPSPSSSPSKGTNSVVTTSSTTLKIDSLPSSDGKV